MRKESSCAPSALLFICEDEQMLSIQFAVAVKFDFPLPRIGSLLHGHSFVSFSKDSIHAENFECSLLIWSGSTTACWKRLGPVFASEDIDGYPFELSELVDARKRSQNAPI